MGVELKSNDKWEIPPVASHLLDCKIIHDDDNDEEQDKTDEVEDNEDHFIK